MNKFILLTFTFSLPFLLLGQENKLPNIRLSASYFGETLTHTGANVGIEYYPYPCQKFQPILAANVGGYVHIRNNTSLFLRGQWGQRITFAKGIFVEEFLGIGYLHQFTHGGKNYEVLPNGAVNKIPNNGKPMIMPSISLGTGYDFSQKINHALLIFIRPELFWKAPFNGYYLTHFALNAGFIFNINKK